MASFSTDAFSETAFDPDAFDFGDPVAEDTASKLVMPDFDDGGVERRRRTRKKEAEIAELARLAQIELPTSEQLPAEEFISAIVEPPPEISPRVRKPVDPRLATAIAGKLKPVELIAAKVETMQAEQQERMAAIQRRRQQDKEDEEALFRLGVFD